MSRRGAAQAPEPEVEEEAPDPPPYGQVHLFGDSTYGVYRDNQWVMLPVDPRKQQEPSPRMFWAAAEPYTPKPKKKRRKKKKP